MLANLIAAHNFFTEAETSEHQHNCGTANSKIDSKELEQICFIYISKETIQQFTEQYCNCQDDTAL